MVYCTKCGTENEEEAEVCTNCGISLKKTDMHYRRKDWDWDWDDNWRWKRNNFWPFVFGGFLILLGLSQLFEEVFWWFSFDMIWPVFLIGIGFMIITNGWKRKF